jgi:hypothetical protein
MNYYAAIYENLRSQYLFVVRIALKFPYYFINITANFP